MVSATAALTVEFLEVLKVKALDHGIDNAYRVILRYLFGGVTSENSRLLLYGFACNFEDICFSYLPLNYK